MSTTERIQEQIDTLLNLTPEHIIRVYPNAARQITRLSYCIMKNGISKQDGRGQDNENVLVFVASEKADTNSWVSESEDKDFGGDGTIRIYIDSEGEKYVEYKNGDFSSPFTAASDAVEEMLAKYQSILSSAASN